LSNLQNLIERIRSRSDTAINNSMLNDAVETLERLQGALRKIGNRYPCSTVETMSRLAKETIGE
jgi:hypothetical protein